MDHDLSLGTTVSKMYLQLFHVHGLPQHHKKWCLMLSHMTACSWACHLSSQVFCHFSPALYEKLPRKRHKGEQREEDTPICKRERGERATVRKVRGTSEVPWLQGASQSYRVNTKMCVRTCVHWDLGVPGNSRDSKWCQSNLWTTELRTNKRIF